jgi:uncharacterized protein (TIGR03086 family)
MSANGAAAALGGVALLERAINYTLGSLRLVRPEALAHPTPCAGWDLRSLLRHLDDSLAALTESAEVGQVDLAPAPAPFADPVAGLRDRASRLLGAWTTQRREVVRIGAAPLYAAVVSGTGAIEVAVHGWDVGRACGYRRPLPAPLADELLDLVPFVVTGADRAGLFGPSLAVPAAADPSARLLAYLGRHA